MGPDRSRLNIHVGGALIVQRGRPLPISEPILIRHLNSLIDFEEKGLVEVFDHKSQRVDLKQLRAEVEGNPPHPPPPEPTLEEVELAMSIPNPEPEKPNEEVTKETPIEPEEPVMVKLSISEPIAVEDELALNQIEDAPVLPPTVTEAPAEVLDVVMEETLPPAVVESTPEVQEAYEEEREPQIIEEEEVGQVEDVLDIPAAEDEPEEEEQPTLKDTPQAFQSETRPDLARHLRKKGKKGRR